ncbi:MAG: ornithine carbamoyltransferase, partial [Burkholderiales bacterium]
VKHFIQLTDFHFPELDYLFQRTRTMKDRWSHGDVYQPLRAKTLGMIFEKRSTRTRVSFEAGMTQLGGSAMFLSPNDLQLGGGESMEDFARVITRMVDIVLIRTHKHGVLEQFSTYSRVPVINGLSDAHHPCQILADIFTYTEKSGAIHGKTVAWIGDGNNMCRSWMQAAAIFDFKLNICVPRGYELASPQADAASRIEYFEKPVDAAREADMVTTDVWTSMGFEQEAEKRRKDFAGFQVTPQIMAMAKPDALFMHCLPAHRGEEVAAEVIDGPQSVVWDEAENRLHTAKALLEYLLLGKIRSGAAKA